MQTSRNKKIINKYFLQDLDRNHFKLQILMVHKLHQKHDLNNMIIYIEKEKKKE